MEQNKYYNRAKEILANHGIEPQGMRYNPDSLMLDALEAMYELAEEVEKELNNRILFLEIMCKAKDKTIRDYYNTTNLYTKEQVEELLQKQRELCLKKVKLDALETFGTDISDCWSEDSILNAKLKLE